MTRKPLIVVGIIVAVAIIGIGAFEFNLLPIENRDVNSSQTKVFPADNLFGITKNQSMTDENNEFALDFYSILSRYGNGQNLFFSPTSIASAFGVMYEGARGDTASEIGNTFGFSPDDNKRRSEFESLYKSINKESEWYKLNMANALWIAQVFEPTPDYVDIAKKHYDSNVQNVDFVTDEGINTINEWARQKTNNKIQEILPLGSTDENTALVITNSMYFNGIWSSPFDTRKTSNEKFWVNSSTSVMVPMMKEVDLFNYAKDYKMQALEMNYVGGKISMLVLLPHDRDGIDTLEKSLDMETLRSIKEKLKQESLTVHMPKFKFNTEYDLIEKLQMMGMRQAFDENNANFDGITEKQIYISKAVHKAFVDVNEKGTEAAAVTAAIGTLQSGPPEPRHDFIADHPFVFVMQDKETGHILFMGRIVDPTK